MATANEELAAFAVHHSIFLERYKSGTVKKILTLLNRLDADLVKQLSQNLSEAGTNRRRLETLLAQLRAINNTIATRIQTELENELRQFISQEAASQAESIHEAIKLDLAIYAPAPDQLFVAAMAEPFAGGRMLSEWIESFSEARQARIRDQIRIGFASGEGIDQIVRRIRGSRANQFRDGILESSRRDIRTIVRSSIAHMSAEVRERTYAVNEHLLDAEIWDSHMDGRTTLRWCIPRSGKLYTVGTHKPIGHDLPWLQGAGRIHPGCRSVSRPKTKSFRSMGLALDEPPPGTRPYVAFEPIRDDNGRPIPLPKPASKMSVAEYTRAMKQAGISQERINVIKSRLIGQVPAEMDYENFLKSRSRSFVASVLGEKKSKLFLDGGVSLRDLVTKQGDELTLDELRVKERAAWKKAGLD